MSATGVDVFDRTLQTTHIWLNEIGEHPSLAPDKQLSWHVLGAVLRAIRDNVPVELAAHFGAELPLLVRGAYYDQFRPEVQPRRLRSREAFLKAISDELATSRPVDPADAARAVFKVLAHYLNPDQIRKIRMALPEPARALWPDPDVPVATNG